MAMKRLRSTRTTAACDLNLSSGWCATHRRGRAASLVGDPACTGCHQSRRGCVLCVAWRVATENRRVRAASLHGIVWEGSFRYRTPFVFAEDARCRQGTTRRVVPPPQSLLAVCAAFGRPQRGILVRLSCRAIGLRRLTPPPPRQPFAAGCCSIRDRFIETQPIQTVHVQCAPDRVIVCVQHPAQVWATPRLLLSVAVHRGCMASAALAVANPCRLRQNLEVLRCPHLRFAA